MATNSTSLEKQVDQLFAALNAKHGDCCRNPVTGVSFVWGLDPVAVQKTEAVRALCARARFAANWPERRAIPPSFVRRNGRLPKCRRSEGARWVLRPIAL